MKSVKLPVWINDGWALLKLARDQRLEHYTWDRTDEGWSSLLTIWRFDGHTVTRFVRHDGRDCDGRLTESYESHVKACNVPFFRDVLESLDQYGFNTVTVPWEHGDTRRRDEYAEAMNY